MFPRRRTESGAYQYEITPGRWVSRQRVNQLRNKQASLARHYLLGAVADGRIERGTCEECGAAQVEAHHEDYGKPYDVRWLCPTHHRALDARPRRLQGAPLELSPRRGGRPPGRYATPYGKSPRYPRLTGGAARRNLTA